MTTSKSIRKATAEDLPVLAQIRNDAHANKVARGDYAWGRKGDGFSEAWVLKSLAQRDVYVVEQDGTPVGTFSLDWDDETYWGPQDPIPAIMSRHCMRDWSASELQTRASHAPATHSFCQPEPCPYAAAKAISEGLPTAT